MFRKTYQATHPSMIDGIDNQALCDLYQVTGLFADDEISLNYSHNERLVIGGAVPVGGDVRLPHQAEPVEGTPFLERRELGVINVGDGSGKVTVDGQSFDIDPRDGLYVPMGSKDVVFSSEDSKNRPNTTLRRHRPMHASNLSGYQSRKRSRSSSARSRSRTTGRFTNTSCRKPADPHSCCSA